MSDQSAPTQKRITNSGFGVVSLVIGFITGGIFLLEVVGNRLGGVLVLAGMGGVAGFMLGIVGLFDKGKKKLFAILGMIMSSPAILMLAFHIILIATHPGN